ncbi:MAG TPA: hypothetical protein VII83_00720, partial [Gaiellaceae bacterium]
MTRAASKALTLTEAPACGEPGGEPLFVGFVVVEPVVVVVSRDGSVVVGVVAVVVVVVVSRDGSVVVGVVAVVV